MIWSFRSTDFHRRLMSASRPVQVIALRLKFQYRCHRRRLPAQSSSTNADWRRHAAGPGHLCNGRAPGTTPTPRRLAHDPQPGRTLTFADFAPHRHVGRVPPARNARSIARHAVSARRVMAARPRSFGIVQATKYFARRAALVSLASHSPARFSRLRRLCLFCWRRLAWPLVIIRRPMQQAMLFSFLLMMPFALVLSGPTTPIQYAETVSVMMLVTHRDTSLTSQARLEGRTWTIDPPISAASVAAVSR